MSNYNDLENKLKKIFENMASEVNENELPPDHYFGSFNELDMEQSPNNANIVEVGVENIISVTIAQPITDKNEIKNVLETGKFYTLTANINGETKKYINSKKHPAGVSKVGNQYITNKSKHVINFEDIIKLEVNNIIDDRTVIQESFGNPRIKSYRIGFVTTDEDPRKIRVSGKKMTSCILDKSQVKFDATKNKIIITKDTILKDPNTYQANPALFDALKNGLQSLDRTRNVDDKDRLQINDNLITDEDIMASGIDAGDTAEVAKFVRQNNYAIIPQEIMKMPNKDNLKRYLSKNPIIQRYIRIMKKSMNKMVSPMATGETSEEGAERVEAGKLFKELGDEIFVILDADVLEPV
jgi:hypothetical protein